jgi:predicted nucleotide-binding protein
MEFGRWVKRVADWLEAKIRSPVLSAQWSALSYSGLVASSGGYYDDPNVWDSFRRGVQQRLEWLGRTLKRLEDGQPKEPKQGEKNRDQTVSRRVFIVHGRDDGAKNEVALFLRKIGLEDIILHQRPSRGRHLLTKFQEEAQGASFAVVLMTPDDEGGIVGGENHKRARQNVVFELGFFIGIFGTPRVAALIRPGVEKPSDFDGVCWIDFVAGGNWKNELARELREAGVPFEAHEVLNA